MLEMACTVACTCLILFAKACDSRVRRMFLTSVMHYRCRTTFGSSRYHTSTLHYKPAITGL